MENFEMIYSYTRKQAIEDGVLVDVTGTAKEAGFRFPVAVTAAVWADIEDIPEKYSYQSASGRLWDVLTMLLFAIRASGGDSSQLHFSLTMHIGENAHYALKSVCGPGDDAEPVITIMRPGED